MRAVFLDRDGVLNRKALEGQYITCWEDMEILPGSLEAVARLFDDGFSIFLATNQRGLALGQIKASDIEIMHANLQRKLAALGATLAGIYICPHDLTANCACRKPRPGLLHAAAREHYLDLNECWMIGDSLSDVVAGHEAGCRTVLIGCVGSLGSQSIADLYAENLDQAASQILSSEISRPGCSVARK